MALRYSTPRELVEALQQRGDGARAQLQEFLRLPITRLMDELRVRYSLTRNGASLAHHALHAAETHVRTRPAHLFASMSWPAFRASILLHVAKMASQPFGQRSESIVSPGPLPQAPGYRSETLFLPHERVGDYWFGGDWFGGFESNDGCLWVLVADITGHGYYAYLLASTLPGVWRACWESGPTQPTELLTAMHELLQDCLPEGVYVECTLVRLHPGGEVDAVPAGGSRLLLRRGGRGQTVLHKLRGAWLGLAPPSTKDQHSWTLEDGDELLLATDGVFDQLHELSTPDVAAHLDSSALELSLLDGVRDLLRQSLEAGGQKDDITMVLLRRSSAARAVSPVPIPGSSSPNEAGDVPV
jgi:serine phosphatase RsbU (regulator of sigma subunit)